MINDNGRQLLGADLGLLCELLRLYPFDLHLHLLLLT